METCVETVTCMETCVEMGRDMSGDRQRYGWIGRDIGEDMDGDRGGDLVGDMAWAEAWLEDPDRIPTLLSVTPAVFTFFEAEIFLFINRICHISEV